VKESAPTMTGLTPSARAVLECDHLAHLVTQGQDGSPHVTLAWTGLDGDEIVIGSLGHFRKLRNIENDPRVSVSIEDLGLHPIGLREYLVVYGTARIEAGGAADLLRRLARVYIGAVRRSRRTRIRRRDGSPGSRPSGWAAPALGLRVSDGRAATLWRAERAEPARKRSAPGLGLGRGDGRWPRHRSSHREGACRREGAGGDRRSRPGGR
jgi:PPOX class probable F420-dependent enzyme